MSTPETAVAQGLAAAPPRARLLHVVDAGSKDSAMTAFLHQISIELSQGLDAQVWNLLRLPEPGWSGTFKRVMRSFPTAVTEAEPEEAALAFVYGLEALEALARARTAAPARQLTVIVRSRAQIESAKAILAERQWPGSAQLFSAALFTHRAPRRPDIWPTPLCTGVYRMPAPDRLRLALSLAGRPATPEDLGLLQRLRQHTGLELVVLADPEDGARLTEAGVTFVPVQSNRDYWSKLLAGADILLHVEGAVGKAQLKEAIGQALIRQRAVIALGAAAEAAPGITPVADESALFALLRQLGDGAARAAFLQRSRAEVDAAAGAGWYLDGLATMLAAAGVAPPATDPGTAIPAADADPAQVVDFILQVPAQTAVGWLLLGPQLAHLRKVLALMTRQIEVTRLADLHEAAEVVAAAQPGRIAEPLRFWLGVEAAAAYASCYLRQTAFTLMDRLAAHPLCATLGLADQIIIRHRLAAMVARLNRRDEALAMLAEVAQAHPTNLTALTAYGIALTPDQPDAALAVLQKAVDLARKPSARILLGHAAALTALERHEAALDSLRTALALHGETPAIRVAIANAHLALGARKDWAEVLEPLLPRTAEGLPTVEIDGRTDVPILQAFRRPAALPDRPAAPDQPLVAVIMTVFNAVETVGQAMQSVLAQTYPHLRLVVVDDCSTDGSLAVVRALARQDPRVIVLQQPVNGGTYVAKNHALALVRADFYTFHDSDDWMHPDRIARHLDFMADHPDVVCSYSRWVRLAADGSIAFPPQENPASSFLRRQTFEEFGYFDMVRASADGEYRWRLRRRYGRAAVPVLDDVLTIGTRHDRSLTTSGATGFDDFGYNGQRIDYAEAWSRWHRSLADPAELHLPFPQQERRFPAPAALAVPVAPIPHPFNQRPETESPPADAIVVEWPAGPEILRNWGDKLNPVLVQQLSGRAVINHGDPKRDKSAPVHLVIGSGLANTRANKLAWGSGFINAEQRLRETPREICAVRGPLSRAHVIETEGSCTDVLGDAALLCPLIYLPQIAPSYDVGLILHFREAGMEPLPMLPEGRSVLLIDINGGIEEVIDNILSCRHIVSSSLHGIIAAHAYGVPATWMSLSDRPKGDGFKFRDYWASVGRPDITPTLWQPGSAIDYDTTVATPGDRVLVDLYRLLRAAPFLDPAQAEALVAKAKALRGAVRPGSILNRHAGIAREG